MKSIDIKSVIIGVLGTILVFVSIGAKSQYEHLSDIVCNSITVLDNGTGGYIKISNSDGKQTSYLGTAENGDGFLSTSNSDGKKTSAFTAYDTPSLVSGDFRPMEIWR